MKIIFTAKDAGLSSAVMLDRQTLRFPQTAYCALLFSVFTTQSLSQPMESGETPPDEETIGETDQQGYYRFPTLYGDRTVFTAEDDLWEVSSSGGVARRLTTNLGSISSPSFSPDGKWLAFTGSEEGPPDVYLMPSSGGPVRRVTHLGSARVVGWQEDRILFASRYRQALRMPGWIYSVAPDGTGLEELPYGPANRLARHGKTIVLGRKNRDPARWKRYRGGTAGELWIDRDGTGNFQELIGLDGNLADPMILKGRVFFLSDHEGTGNIYSCTFEGGDLKKHSHLDKYYARNASSDGARIVFHAGADIHVCDPKSGETTKIEIEFRGPKIQTARKFKSADKYLEDYNLSSDGAYLSLACRGKAFTLGCWEGPVFQHGHRHGVRYRLVNFMKDGKHLVLVSDDGGEDQIEIHAIDNSTPPRKVEIQDLGRPIEMEVSPKSDSILVVNHRNELIHVDLDSGESRVIDRDEHRPLSGFCWSHDGKWVAYGCSVNLRQTVIKMYNVEERETHPVTRPVLWDYSPSFDSEGKYLFFLSRRSINPVYDQLQFELGFPRAGKPYLVTLRKDVPSPFVPEPKGFGEKEDDSDDKKDEEEKTDKKTEEGAEDKEEKNEKPFNIEFEGIEDRVVPFPVGEGIYDQLRATEGRAYYTTKPIEGSIDSSWSDRTVKAKHTLKYYNLVKREEKTLSEKMSNFKISGNRSALVLRAGNKLRVVAADSEKLEEKEDKNRKSGWIDLTRPKVSIDPIEEWKQMLKEAWRLQRDYFWTEDMSQVEWDEALKRYLPLVGRVSSRHEFADLVWEMQGELGTSHAYEFGGDYRDSPKYGLGYLGADLAYNEEKDSWIIKRAIPGDNWDPKHAPPLERPAVNIRDGMLLLAVNGMPTSRITSPHQLLVNQGNTEVSLLVADDVGAESSTVTVKTLKSESKLRYRDWVETNRKTVHERSDGKVGYLHIPNMGAFGYSEFHRYFLVEIDHDGLIVDVRYNGGGHVSQLLLEKLARRRIGYSFTRWMGTEPYPSESPQGPMVCLTNEFAGSDGDIFSHGFKEMGLGKLIGRRTWGGVIGIWPRNSLVDGTTTTQPEFSFWFKDIEWGVENYGVDPDIEVDILPQDWAAGRDPQLDRAIEEVLKEIEINPPLKPNFENRPNLRHPR